MDMNNLLSRFFDYYNNLENQKLFKDDFVNNFSKSEIHLDNYYNPSKKKESRHDGENGGHIETRENKGLEFSKIEELLDRLSLGKSSDTIESELKFMLDNIDDNLECMTTLSGPTSITNYSNPSCKTIQDPFLGFTKVLTPTPIPLIKNYAIYPMAQQLLSSIGTGKLCLVSSLGQAKVGKSFLANILLSRPHQRRFPLSKFTKAHSDGDSIQAYIFLAEYDSQDVVYGFIDWTGEADLFQTRIAVFISDAILFHYAHEKTSALDSFLNSISKMVSEGAIGDDSSGSQNLHPIPIIKVLVHDSPKYSIATGHFKNLENYSIVSLPFPIDEVFDSSCENAAPPVVDNTRTDPSLYPPHSYCLDFNNACDELKRLLFVEALERSKNGLIKNGSILQHTLTKFDYKNPEESFDVVWKLARRSHDESLRFQCKEMFLKYIRQELQPLLPVGTKHLLEKCYEYKIHILDHHKKNVLGEEQDSLTQLSQKLDRIINKAIKENEEFAERANLDKLKEIGKRFTSIEDIKSEYDKNIQGPSSVHYRTFRAFEAGTQVPAPLLGGDG